MNNIQALTHLHVISAVGWLGGAVLFLSVIAPGLRSLSPAASLEFLAKVGPRATWFFIGAATSTVIFGQALFFTLAGDFPATHGIYIGIILGLIAYLVGMIVTVPSLWNADRLAHEMMTSGQAGPPPAEFTQAMKRGGIGTTLVVVLLLLAVIFMVASGSSYF